MVLINSEVDKYAVIVGINYTGANIALNGCINDANAIQSFLLKKCNYQSSNIKLLTDDSIKPTKEKIIRELNTLVQKATTEGITEFWFSYSGHGSSVLSLSNTESDNKDEVLVPYDYPTSNNLIKLLIIYFL